MSQKASTSSTPSSIIRAAFERLSFGSRRKKNIKYDLVIEKKEKPDVDKSELDFESCQDERSENKCESNSSRVSQSLSSPVPTPTQLYASHGDQPGALDDREGRGGHLMSLDRARLTGSKASLGTRESDAEAGGRMDRASSLAALAQLENDIKVPDNQLQSLNSYQRRVQASMEKLTMCDWFKTASKSPSAPPTPRLSSSNSTPERLTSSWRSSTLSSQPGWRRQGSVTSSSRSSTLERKTSTMSSQEYRSRMSTLTSTSSTSSQHTPVKPVYLGWRSQERLDSGPSYVTTPAQRLASTALEVKLKIDVTKNTTIKDVDNVQTNIKEVTDAIMNFCKSSISDKECGEEENVDGDSGIDRSEDFTQEVLSEITVRDGKSLYSF